MLLTPCKGDASGGRSGKRLFPAGLMRQNPRDGKPLGPSLAEIKVGHAGYVPRLPAPAIELRPSPMVNGMISA